MASWIWYCNDLAYSIQSHIKVISVTSIQFLLEAKTLLVSELLNTGNFFAFFPLKLFSYWWLGKEWPNWLNPCLSYTFPVFRSAPRLFMLLEMASRNFQQNWEHTISFCKVRSRASGKFFRLSEIPRQPCSPFNALW